MADDANSDTKDTKDAAAKPAGNGIVSIAILGVVCAASAFGVVFMLPTSQASESPACAATVSAEVHSEPLASENIDYVELEEMLVTIGSGAESRFVKLQAVVMAPKGEAARVEEASPMLADAFLSYLRAIEVSDYQSASFYPDMREQLSRRAELVLGAEHAHGVLITEFLLR